MSRQTSEDDNTIDYKNYNEEEDDDLEIKSNPEISNMKQQTIK